MAIMRGLLAVLCLAIAIEVAAQTSQAEAQKQNVQKQVESAVTDASLRSPLAVPKAVFEVEIGEDKKKATAKIGLAWGAHATSEAGFTGAFDQKAPISKLTSLRELTSGSHAWFATTWKKYRVQLSDWTLAPVVCRQAAWAVGKAPDDFDCVDEDLPSTSFAEDLAALKHVSFERRVCQEFVRSRLTLDELAKGADLSSGVCDSPEQLIALQTTSGAAFTETYEARYAGARDAAAGLAVCNEFRRSRRLPPLSTCDPSEFDDAEKKAFGQSWADRFEQSRTVREAAICDAYRRARGEAPTGRGACAPATGDPLFTESFQSRYRRGYAWHGTPMWGFRVEGSRPTFKFFDDDLEAQKQTHAAYAFSVHAGWLTPGEVLFSLQFRRGESWKAPDPTELCRPLGETGATTCQADAVLGAPSRRDVRQLEFQVKSPLGGDAALSVIVTRDFERRAWGLEAPLYFMSNKDGGLAGGVVVGYTHERGKGSAVSASVFVGQVFGL